MRMAAIVGLLLATATAAVADPDDKPADPAAVARAKKAYAKARELHERGEYQKAAAAYLAVYSDYPDPELYFNAAQVYRLGGEKGLALGYYRRYLELDPNGRAAPEAREHIGELAPEIGKIQQPGSAASRWGDAPDGPSASASASGGVRVEGGNVILRGSAIALAVGGAVSFGLAISSGIEARSISAELSTTERWTDERLARFDDGEAAESRAKLYTAVGAVAVVGAGVLWWLGGPKVVESQTVAAGPVAGGGFAVSAAGRF